eukprot:TRINITY_DN13708_c0_g1_i5.p2 TRINITY_DN13708_c0_g1~~TRINITY_DN13708_c0_g1_i5.p2  ORF type:complete len:209 (+),score=-28.59 TRINITY_DN13708_c0_g1_i5:447-1073(+)
MFTIKNIHTPIHIKSMLPKQINTCLPSKQIQNKIYHACTKFTSNIQYQHLYIKLMVTIQNSRFGKKQGTILNSTKFNVLYIYLLPLQNNFNLRYNIGEQNIYPIYVRVSYIYVIHTNIYTTFVQIYLKYINFYIKAKTNYLKNINVKKQIQFQILQVLFLVLLKRHTFSYRIYKQHLPTQKLQTLKYLQKQRVYQKKKKRKKSLRSER